MRISKSFGLIEVLVTAGIFIIFIGSLVSLSSVSSRNIIINKHRLQAANLAREGIELVGQIRDTAWRNDDDYSQWPGTCWGLASGADRWLENFQGVGGCDFWHYHLVSYDVPIPPIDNVEYERIINIDNKDLYPGGGNDTKKVTVTVSWQDFGQDKSVEMVTYLTDWEW